MTTVLDTNAVSAMMRADPDEQLIGWLDAQPDNSLWTTSVSIFELRFGLLAMPRGRRQVALCEAFEKLLTECFENRIFVLDREAAECAAELAAERRSAGRSIDVKDTLIAGIALSRRAKIATRNMRHFADLGAGVVDPWTPE